MKRWTLIPAGWALVVIAIGAFLYQLVVLWGMPIYSASALVGFDPENPAQRANLASVCSRQSFVLSTNVLYPVCDSLNLANKWGTRYFGGERMTTKDIYPFLVRRIRVSYPRNGKGPAQIFYYNEKPDEAITIANAIASSVTNQLTRLERATNSSLGMWVENATEERRRYGWISFGSGIIFIVIPCGIAGIILLWLGYHSPRLILPLPPPSQPFRSKY
ncbi:MAG: hypothetical protein ABSH11_11525 [Verrucomicrobiota bacterium]|jgi:hypothetical protein